MWYLESAAVVSQYEDRRRVNAGKEKLIHCPNAIKLACVNNIKHFSLCNKANLTTRSDVHSLYFKLYVVDYKTSKENSISYKLFACMLYVHMEKVSASVFL